MIIKSNQIGINHIWVCGHKGSSDTNPDTPSEIENGVYWTWQDGTFICFDDETLISVE